MVTVPPPYSPFGISPANLKYSSGWSSTCTARWFFFGSGGMPLGTAHDTPTPSFSSRKSQCSRRAWCSWTTNRGALVSLRGTLAPGSGVRLKSRFASYSASFLATNKRLGHGRFFLIDGQRGRLAAADERRRESSQRKDDDRHNHGRVHRVDERAGEDVVRYRLDLRRQLQACARLPDANFESGARGMAETVDERASVLLRQLAGSGNRPVVQGDGQTVLEERADHGAGQDASHLLNRVDDAGSDAAEPNRQVARRDAENRGPDAAHAEAADDEARRKVPATRIRLGGPVDVTAARGECEQSRDQQG